MITVVGTLALDTMGEVERLPSLEETGGVRRVQPDVFGGTAGNVAMALARLGARPRVLAAVGPDFADGPYERALARAGVDLSLVVRAGEPTSRAYIFFDGAGRQTTYFYPGASKALADAKPRVEGRVHFAAGEIGAYPALMRQAEWVSFDPGQEVFHRDLAQVAACLEHVDLLFLNRHERERMEKETRLLVPDLVRAGAIVAETRGADGAILHAPVGDVRVPAAPAAFKDPTGAGDAHRAGFLFALDRGAPLDKAARFAAVLGAFAVESVGPQGNLPTLDQARRRYQDAWGEPAPV